MKAKISLVVSLFLGLTVISPLAWGQQNILGNPSFEDSVASEPSSDNWYRYSWNGDPLMERDNTVAHTGTYSGKISGSMPFEVCWGQDPVNIEDGTTIEVGYWVKTENVTGGRGVCLILGWNNSSVGGVELHGTNDWTYVSGTCTYEVSSWTPIFRLYCGCDSGTVWFDDASVVVLGTPPTMGPVTATPGDGKVSLSWAPASEGTSPVDHYLISRIFLGEGTNLIDNPGFEEPDSLGVNPAHWGSFTWWSAGDPPSYEWQTDEVHSGLFGVMIRTATDNEEDRAHAMWYQYVDVEPSTDYLLWGWVKSTNIIPWEHPSPPCGGAMIRVGGGTGEPDPWGEGLFGDNDWTSVTYPIDSQSNNRVLVGARIGRDYATSTGTAYFDDISLVKFDSIGVTADTFFVDTGLTNDTTYFYSVRAVDTDGLLSNGSFAQAKPTSGIDDTYGSIGQPRSFALLQNYPNPFNSTTLIRYQLSAVGRPRTAVTLKVYNIAGQLVRTLVDGVQAPGYYKVNWDGESDRGTDLASGIYICRLGWGDLKSARKMVLIR